MTVADDRLPSADILRKVRKLEIRTRGLVESRFGGDHPSMYHGSGFDFSHVRAYQAGDDVRAIDWKVTARRQTPFVRQFVEERDLPILLLVDVSASGRLGPGERSPGEVAAEIAAAIAFIAVRQNDRVALLLVSDRLEHVLELGSGRKHVVRLLAELLSHRPRGTGTDLGVGLEWIARSLAGRAAVFVISDFIHPHSPGFRERLGRVARANDVVAIRLASAAADELPDVGWLETTDPESGRRVVLNTRSRRVRARYRRSIQRSRAEMASLLTEVGAELVDVDTAADPLAALSLFFRRRHEGRR